MLHEIETRIKLTLEHKPGWTTSIHRGCKIALILPTGFAEEMYFDKKGDMTLLAAKTQTSIMVSGLAANIHANHETGVWDSAEHLRHIITELEKQFVEVGKIDKPNFNEKP